MLLLFCLAQLSRDCTSWYKMQSNSILAFCRICPYQIIPPLHTWEGVMYKVPEGLSSVNVGRVKSGLEAFISQVTC